MPKTLPISHAMREMIREAVANGEPKNEVAARLGVGKTTVHRVCSDMQSQYEWPQKDDPTPQEIQEWMTQKQMERFTFGRHVRGTIL